MIHGINANPSLRVPSKGLDMCVQNVTRAITDSSIDISEGTPHLVAFAIGQAFASLIPFGRSTTSAEYNPVLRMPPSFLVAALLAAVPIAYAPLSGLVRVLRKVTGRRCQPDAVAMHDERVLRPAAAAAATTALAPAAADGETPSGSATASTLGTVRGVPLKALRLLGVSEEDIRNR